MAGVSFGSLGSAGLKVRGGELTGGAEAWLKSRGLILDGSASASLCTCNTRAAGWLPAALACASVDDVGRVGDAVRPGAGRSASQVAARTGRWGYTRAELTYIRWVASYEEPDMRRLAAAGRGSHALTIRAHGIGMQRLARIAAYRLVVRRNRYLVSLVDSYYRGVH